MKQYYIRAKIDFFDFATGLLNGGSVPMNTIFNATPSYDGEIGTITGSLFECISFLTFVNGSYDSRDLKEMKSPDNFKKPEDFIIEEWETTNDNYHWKLVNEIKHEGVQWLTAKHTGDGGDRCCAGEATFSFTNKTITTCNGPERIIPSNERYPQLELVRMLRTEMGNDPNRCAW